MGRALLWNKIRHRVSAALVAVALSIIAAAPVRAQTGPVVTFIGLVSNGGQLVSCGSPGRPVVSKLPTWRMERAEGATS